MVQKINDNAYFVVDINSFTATVKEYDPLISNQTICVDEFIEESPEETA